MAFEMYGERKKGGIELNLQNLLILSFLTMVLIQGLGLIIGSAGATIKLGPAFILIAIVMFAAMSIAIFKKVFNNQEVTQKDIFAILIVAFIVVLLMFFLRDFVPEIFVQGMVEMQSFVGM